MRNRLNRKDAKVSQKAQTFPIRFIEKMSITGENFNNRNALRSSRNLCVFAVKIFLVSATLHLTLSCQTDEEIKRQKYITEGILLYRTHCANCHQTDGKGLQALYPPIAGSDYLAKKDSVIHLIRYGQQGPILVNGKRYNRPMPANKQLSDLEIAEIATYIYHQWGNEKTITSVADVKTVFPAR